MQEDYLKREIDRLGQVLASLISKLLGNDLRQNSQEVLFVVTTALTELGLDLTTLLSQPPNVAANEAWSKLKENPTLFEHFADSLVDSVALLKNEDTKHSIKLLNVALACYTKLEIETKAFSISINEKKGEITAILSSTGTV